jgi:hypothetical protein
MSITRLEHAAVIVTSQKYQLADDDWDTRRFRGTLRRFYTRFVPEQMCFPGVPETAKQWCTLRFRQMKFSFFRPLEKKFKDAS